MNIVDIAKYGSREEMFELLNDGIDINITDQV